MLLITGITGHTGSYFLKELIKNQYQKPIRCIVRENSNTSLIDNSDLIMEKVVGTLEDKLFLDKIMKDVETIVHIYNIHHSPTIIQTAIESKVKRVILVHTTGIYSRFKYASEEYKNIEEKVARIVEESNSDIKITILRPTMIYGDLRDKNVSKFIKMVDAFKIIPIINNGENLIQPVHASDLGNAYYKVLMAPEQTAGKAYNLSGKNPIKMKEFLQTISKELDKKVFFVNVPLGIAVFLAKSLFSLTFKKLNYIEKVQRMGENRSYSHKEAIRDFKYDPLKLKKGLHLEVKKHLEAKSK